MHDLVPFAQFKKREKHPWKSVTFSKVNLSPYVFFSRYLVILAFGNYSNLIRISLNIPKFSVIRTSSACVLVLYLISWKNEYASTFNIFFCHFLAFSWFEKLPSIIFDRLTEGSSVRQCLQKYFFKNHSKFEMPIF